MKTYKLKIVTPEKIFFDGETEQITIRTTEGDIGILANHIKYVCNIVAGPLKVKLENGEYREAALSEGILKVSEEGVTVLVSTAEWADEIDLERAEKAKQKAEDILSDKSRIDDFDRAEIKLKRALVRINISKKYL